jgi:hypothetical protein
MTAYQQCPFVAPPMPSLRVRYGFAIGVGVNARVVEPLPRAPWRLSPQQRTEPSRVTPHVKPHLLTSGLGDEKIPAGDRGSVESFVVSLPNSLSVFVPQQ